MRAWWLWRARGEVLVVEARAGEDGGEDLLRGEHALGDRARAQLRRLDDEEVDHRCDGDEGVRGLRAAREDARRRETHLQHTQNHGFSGGCTEHGRRWDLSIVCGAEAHPKG